MNIFFLHERPMIAAQMVCDTHASKMCVEGVQMLVSALLINGAPPEKMPITKTTGKPHKGGYKHHPSTIWTSTNLANWIWLYDHTWALCREFESRYGHKHYARQQLVHLTKHIKWSQYLNNSPQTPIARCFNQSKGLNIDLLDTNIYSDVEAYRQFYIRDKSNIAKWEKGTPTPTWWIKGTEHGGTHDNLDDE